MELCEGADQQGPVGLLVMPEEKGALKGASQPPGTLGNLPPAITCAHDGAERPQTCCWTEGHRLSSIPRRQLKMAAG